MSSPAPQSQTSAPADDAGDFANVNLVPGARNDDLSHSVDLPPPVESDAPRVAAEITAAAWPPGIGTREAISVVPSGNGVSGNATLRVEDVPAFLTDMQQRARVQAFLAEAVHVPSSLVSVPAPEDARADETALPGNVTVSFNIELLPSAATVRDELIDQSPAALTAGLADAGLQATVPGPITATETAAGVHGVLPMVVADQASFVGDVGSANVNAVKTALSNLFRIDPRDIPTVTLEAAAPAAGTTATQRRLQAANVNANFDINVPGLAAQGFVKDCALLNVAVDVMDTTDAAEVRLRSPAESMAACRARCQEDHESCDIFSYDTLGGNAAQCTLSRLDSPQRWQMGSIAVPREGTDGCGPCPPVALTDPSAWPAGSTIESHQAFSGGRQPQNLECWPKKDFTQLMHCGEPTVLQDTDVQEFGVSWAGQCDDLVHQDDISDQEACRADCAGDVNCVIWQWTTENGCWQGSSAQATSWGDCDNTLSARDDFVEKAQRLQHGEVVVIDPDLTDGQLQNLQRMFSGPPTYEDAGTAGRQELCKHICYSNLMCQYWQYIEGDEVPAGSAGCWVERFPDHRVQYPLVSGARNENDADYWTSGSVLPEGSIKAGEFIAHTCPVPTVPLHVPPTTTTNTPTTTMSTVFAVAPASTEQDGGSWWPWAALIGGIALLASVAVAALFLTRGNEKKPTNRGIKPLKKKAPEPEVPPPPAPLPEQPLHVPMIVRPTPTVVQTLAMPQPTIATYAVQAPATAYPQQASGFVPLAPARFAP